MVVGKKIGKVENKGKSESKNQYKALIAEVEESHEKLAKYLLGKLEPLIEGYHQSHRYPLVEVRIDFTQQLTQFRPIIQRLKEIPKAIKEADYACQAMQDRQKEDVDF